MVAAEWARGVRGASEVVAMETVHRNSRNITTLANMAARRRLDILEGVAPLLHQAEASLLVVVDSVVSPLEVGASAAEAHPMGTGEVVAAREGGALPVEAEGSAAEEGDGSS